MIPHGREATLMLTSAAPLVKLAPATTPEQQSCARDIDQALTIFRTLVERLQNAAEEKQPIHHSGRRTGKVFMCPAVLPQLWLDRRDECPGVPGRGTDPQTAIPGAGYPE